jgi:hypothetical protein
MVSIRRPAAVSIATATILLAWACDDSTGPENVARVADAAATITPVRIGATIAALAHDSTLGRGTPTPELDEVAVWLATEMDGAGLVARGTDGFLQPFDYVARGVDGDQTFLELPGLETPSLDYGRDFILFPAAAADATGRLQWGGDITADIPAPGVMAQGSFVLFDHPGTRIDLAWRNLLFAALDRMGERPFTGIGLVLSSEIDEDELAARRDLVASQRYFQNRVFLLTEAAAERLVVAAGTTLATLRAGSPTQIADAFRVHAPPATAVTRPSNVVALIEGSDPALRGTYVVVSAHYDHLGIGFASADGDSIYNGADDNASGTAGLLEVARAMASLDSPPARSVLFLATAAEEKGLLGAFHFVAEPTVPRSAIVANINLDMISRNASSSVRVIGKDYTTMGEQVDLTLASHPDIGLTAFHDGGDIYFGGSDHAAFTRSGIPAIFLFAGLHDDYHTPDDEPDTNDHDKAARVARLAFYVAYAVASDPDPVEFTDLAVSELSSRVDRQ